jgi:hypothetical protein
MQLLVEEYGNVGSNRDDERSPSPPPLKKQKIQQRLSPIPVEEREQYVEGVTATLHPSNVMRVLALVQGRHPRLGAGSAISTLPVNIVENIARFMDNGVPFVKLSRSDVNTRLWANTYRYRDGIIWKDMKMHDPILVEEKSDIWFPWIDVCITSDLNDPTMSTVVYLEPTAVDGIDEYPLPHLTNCAFCNTSTFFIARSTTPSASATISRIQNTPHGIPTHTTYTMPHPVTDLVAGVDCIAMATTNDKTTWIIHSVSPNGDLSLDGKEVTNQGPSYFVHGGDADTETLGMVVNPVIKGVHIGEGWYFVKRLEVAYVQRTPQNEVAITKRTFILKKLVHVASILSGIVVSNSTIQEEDPHTMIETFSITASSIPPIQNQGAPHTISFGDQSQLHWNTVGVVETFVSKPKTSITCHDGIAVMGTKSVYWIWRNGDGTLTISKTPSDHPSNPICLSHKEKLVIFPAWTTINSVSKVRMHIANGQTGGILTRFKADKIIPILSEVLQ